MLENKLIIKNFKGDKVYIEAININDLSILWKNEISSTAIDFLPLKDNSFILFDEGVSKFFSLEKGDVIKNEPVFYFHYDDNLKAYFDASDTSSVYISLKNKGEDIQVSYENSLKYFIGNYLVQSNSPSLNCFDALNQKKLWEIDFSEKGQYEDTEGEIKEGSISLIEHFEDVLCVLLGNNLMLGVEAQSGKILWERQMPKRLIAWPGFYKGKIYYMSPRDTGNYQVIDMKTGETLAEHQLAAIIKEHRLFTNPTITEEWNMMTTTKTQEVFILDKNTAEIIDVVKLDIEDEYQRTPVDNRPLFHDNKLFQLDGDYNLHIFEKV